MKTKLAIYALLSLLCAASCSREQKAPAAAVTIANPLPWSSYTVVIGTGDGGELCRFTNCIAVKPCTDMCTLVRYIKDGQTNEFHAFMVPVKILP